MIRVQEAAHEARQFWTFFKGDRVALFGVLIVVGAVLLALFAPYIAPHPPSALVPDTLHAPSGDYPFGTDQIGRDVLSQMIYGTRVSLVFAIGVAGISLIVGVLIGAIPGYFGGWVDNLFSRIFEIFLMIPQFILIIAVVSLFGNNIVYTMVVVGLTLWPSNAKITRAQVLTLKNRSFVRAAAAAGGGHARILFRHILPNGLYPVITNSTLQMAYAILLEAGLSFLGLGDPNYPSWGQILSAANLHKSAWWMAVFPGLAILTLVLGFNMAAEGLTLAFNPRLRSRQ